MVQVQYLIHELLLKTDGFIFLRREKAFPAAVTGY